MKKDNDNIVFGKSLRRLREKNNLTQEEVAQRTGFDPKYISQLELGKYMGNIKTLLKFCKALNATPNDILLDFIDISVLTDSKREIDKEFNEFYSSFSNLSSKDKKNVMALINSMLSN